MCLLSSDNSETIQMVRRVLGQRQDRSSWTHHSDTLYSIDFAVIKLARTSIIGTFFNIAQTDDVCQICGWGVTDLGTNVVSSRRIRKSWSTV